MGTVPDEEERGGGALKGPADTRDTESKALALSSETPVPAVEAVFNIFLQFTLVSNAQDVLVTWLSARGLFLSFSIMEARSVVEPKEAVTS